MKRVAECYRWLLEWPLLPRRPLRVSPCGCQSIWLSCLSPRMDRRPPLVCQWHRASSRLAREAVACSSGQEPCPGVPLGPSDIKGAAVAESRCAVCMGGCGICGGHPRYLRSYGGVAAGDGSADARWPMWLGTDGVPAHHRAANGMPPLLVSAATLARAATAVPLSAVLTARVEKEPSVTTRVGESKPDSLISSADCTVHHNTAIVRRVRVCQVQWKLCPDIPKGVLCWTVLAVMKQQTRDTVLDLGVAAKAEISKREPQPPCLPPWRAAFAQSCQPSIDSASGCGSALPLLLWTLYAPIRRFSCATFTLIDIDKRCSVLS